MKLVMDLANIMLNEISDTERHRLYNTTYTWNLKNNKLKTEIRFALARDRVSG